MPIVANGQITPDPKGEGPNLTVDTKSLQLIERIAVNVRQEVIVVTRDKVELCMHQHLRTMETRNGWLAPFGIMSTLLVTLVTADFKDIGLKKETWQAVFVIGAFLAFIWLMRALLSIRPRHTVEHVILELMASQQGQQAPPPPLPFWTRFWRQLRR